MRTAINPVDAAPAIGPFSQAVESEGRLLFVSGQGPQLPDGSGFVRGDFEREVRQTLDNLTRVLRAARADWGHVTRVGVYLTRAEHFAEFNRIYNNYVIDPPPARTTIICQLLADIGVEVDCVAVLPMLPDRDS
jgi:2-iminobutanoate/2-iminopropanoate deaminase